MTEPMATALAEPLPDLLATPAELRALPGMADLPEATALLLLEIATAIVQATTGQRLLFTELDELEIGLDAEATSEFLYLPEQPVVFVHAVSIDGTWLSEQEYLVQKARARLWRSGHCSGGWLGHNRRFGAGPSTVPSTVVVIYDHGYRTGDPRLALAKAAALTLAAATVRGAAGAGGGVQSESIGDYAITYAKVDNELASAPTLEAALKRRYARTRFTSIRTTRTDAASYRRPDPLYLTDQDGWP